MENYIKPALYKMMDSVFKEIQNFYLSRNVTSNPRKPIDGWMIPVQLVAAIRQKNLTKMKTTAIRHLLVLVN